MPQPTDKPAGMCDPGELYYFWCDDNVKKNRYPRMCIEGTSFDEGDRTFCKQGGKENQESWAYLSDLVYVV